MNKVANHNSLAEDTVLFNGANRALVIAAVLLLLYYVVQVNMLAADTWHLRTAHIQLTSLRSMRDTLTSQQDQLGDRTTLQSLATQVGMIPAGVVTYVIQASSVATNQ